MAKAKAERTVQTTAVAAVAVERAEAGRVEVLLFVNTGTVKEIAGKAEPQQQVSQNRARFVMIRQGFALAGGRAVDVDRDRLRGRARPKFNCY